MFRTPSGGARTLGDSVRAGAISIAPREREPRRRQWPLDEREGPHQQPCRTAESIRKRWQSHGSLAGCDEGRAAGRPRDGTLGSAFVVRTSQTGAIVEDRSGRCSRRGDGRAHDHRQQAIEVLEAVDGGLDARSDGGRRGAAVCLFDGFCRAVGHQPIRRRVRKRRAFGATLRRSSESRRRSSACRRTASDCCRPAGAGRPSPSSSPRRGPRATAR